jgi:uncharacterized membrane protein YbhN (UPF0104 family)
VALVALGIFLILCATIFEDESDKLAALLEIPNFYLLVASAMFLFNVAVRGVFNWLIFRRLKHKIPLTDYLVLFYFTTALNFFVPLSGSAYTAHFLKINHGIPVSAFFGTFGSFNVLLCVASSIFGVIVLSIAWLITGSLYVELFLVLSSIIIASVTATVLRHRLTFLATGYDNKYGKILDGLITLCTDITLIVVSTMTVLGLILTTFIAIWSLCTGYGAIVDPLQLSLIVISQVLVGIFPLAPGGLGIQESMAVFFGVLMKLDIVELLAIFVMWRFLRLVLLLLLLLPAKLYLNEHD